MAKAVVVVDYGMGNLRSVVNAFEHVGAKVKLSNKSEDIVNSKAVVVPGQGAFRDCIGNIEKYGLVKPLTEVVTKKKKPFFGICLGLEILADTSSEGGKFKGLGWIKGKVRKFEVNTKKYKLPHLGWNDVRIDKKDKLLEGLPKKPCFYFANSYHLVPKNNSLVTLSCSYGERFAAGLRKDNIFAVQFHPEKSQHDGLRLIRNFVEQI